MAPRSNFAPKSTVKSAVVIAAPEKKEGEGKRKEHVTRQHPSPREVHPNQRRSTWELKASLPKFVRAPSIISCQSQ